MKNPFDPIQLRVRFNAMLNPNRFACKPNIGQTNRHIGNDHK